MTLRGKIADALVEKFDGLVTIDNSSNTIAIIAAKHPDVGDLVIEQMDDELVVSVESISHGHFACYEDSLPIDDQESEIVSNVIDFIELLLDEKILLFTSSWGGGWVDCESEIDVTKLSKRKTWYTWSGPLPLGND